MSVIDTVKYTLSNETFTDTLPEKPITERKLLENQFLQFEYLVRNDSSLDEIGDDCVGGFYCCGYSILISKRRVFLVDPQEKLFLFPTLGDCIIDVFMTLSNDDYFLVVLATNLGVYCTVFKTSCLPQTITQTFVSLSKTPQRLQGISSEKVAVCCSGQSVALLNIHFCDSGNIKCDLWESTKNWSSHVSNFFHPHVVQSSFFEKCSGSLLILYEDSIDFWEATETKGLKKSGSLECSQKCIAIVGSTNSSSFATLVFEDGAIASLVPDFSENGCKKITWGKKRELPKELRLTKFTCAAGGIDTLILYSAQQQSLLVLSFNCEELASAGEKKDILTIINIDCSIAFLSSTEKENEFIAYHRDGKMSLIKRFNSGQVVNNYYQQWPTNFIPSYYQKAAVVKLLLEGMSENLPFESFSSIWNELMSPIPESVVSSSSVWRLSHGALGCAAYLSELLSKQHQFIFLAKKDINNNLVIIHKKLQRMYCLLCKILDGWIEYSENHLGVLEWNTIQVSNANSFKEAINAQAQYLAALNNFLRRAIGYSFLVVLLKVYCPNFKTLEYTMVRGAPAVVNWFELLSQGGLDEWEAMLCLELAATLLKSDNQGSMPEGHSSVDFENIRVQLSEVSQFLSEKPQIIIHISLLLFSHQYDNALKFCLQHVDHLVNIGLWKSVTTLLESRCRFLFPTMKLLYSRLSHYRSIDGSYFLLKELFQLLDDISDVMELSAALTFLTEGLPNGEKKKAHNDIASSRCSFFFPELLKWMMRLPLNDYRIPVFEKMLREKEAAWSFCVDEEGAPVEKNGCYRIPFHFYQCSLLESAGDRHAAAKGFGELAVTDERLLLEIRISLIHRAISLVEKYLAFSSKQPQHSHDQGEPQLLSSLELSQYTLKLQAQLLLWLQKYQKNSDMKNQEPVGDVDVLPHQILREYLNSDIQTLEYTAVNPDLLLMLARRYRALGGASVELDLLKIDRNAEEEVVADALRSLLAFLKFSTNLNPEKVVETIMKNPYLFQRFYAPFPLYPLIEFLVLEQETQSATTSVRINIKKIAEVLLKSKVSPVSLFEYFLQLLSVRAPLYQEEGPMMASWAKRVQVDDIMEAAKLVLENIVDPESKQECTAHLEAYLSSEREQNFENCIPFKST